MAQAAPEPRLIVEAIGSQHGGIGPRRTGYEMHSLLEAAAGEPPKLTMFAFTCVDGDWLARRETCAARSIRWQSMLRPMTTSAASSPRGPRGRASITTWTAREDIKRLPAFSEISSTH